MQTLIILLLTLLLGCGTANIEDIAPIEDTYDASTIDALAYDSISTATDTARDSATSNHDVTSSKEDITARYDSTPMDGDTSILDTIILDTVPLDIIGDIPQDILQDVDTKPSYVCPIKNPATCMLQTCPDGETFWLCPKPCAKDVASSPGCYGVHWSNCQYAPNSQCKPDAIGGWCC
jgi:hypothetical protein